MQSAVLLSLGKSEAEHHGGKMWRSPGSRKRRRGRVWGQEVTVVTAVAYLLQLDPQTYSAMNSSMDGSTAKVSYNLHDPAKKPSAQEPVVGHGTAKSNTSSLDSCRFFFLLMLSSVCLSKLNDPPQINHYSTVCHRYIQYACRVCIVC